MLIRDSGFFCATSHLVSDECTCSLNSGVPGTVLWNTRRLKNHDYFLLMNSLCLDDCNGALTGLRRWKWYPTYIAVINSQRVNLRRFQADCNHRTGGPVISVFADHTPHSCNDSDMIGGAEPSGKTLFTFNFDMNFHLFQQYRHPFGYFMQVNPRSEGHLGEGLGGCVTQRWDSPVNSKNLEKLLAAELGRGGAEPCSALLSIPRGFHCKGYVILIAPLWLLVAPI